MPSFAAIKGEPDIAGMIQLALQLHKSGNFEQALCAYDEILPVLGKVTANVAATIHSNRGALLSQSGAYAAAKDAFAAAVDVQPENINARFNLALTLTSKLGEHLKAIRHCAAVLKQDSGHVKALHLMGLILQSLNRPVDANKYFSLAAQAEEGVGAEAGVAKGSSAGGAPAHSPLAWGQWGDGMRRLAEASVGTVFTHTHNGQNLSLVCTSESPRVFRIANLLSAEECKAIKTRAEPHLQYSYVTGGKAVDRNDADGYRTSINAWLSPDALLLDVQQRLAGLLRLQSTEGTASISAAALQQAAEELQVIRYEAGGQFKVHHDSSSFHPRVFTMLVYLNDVDGAGESATGGGTWFPFSSSGLAGGAVQVDAADDTAPLTVEQANSAALAAFETCKEGGNVLDQGLVTVPALGSAVLFFNHLPSGELDARAVHAGLPVAVPPGQKRDGVQKWAANYWFGGVAR